MLFIHCSRHFIHSRLATSSAFPITTMTIHALWIISKAGGLVFSRSYSDALPQLPVNTILTLAGILHGIHAITARLTPSSPNQNQGSGSGSAGGLESFEAEGWGGKVFLTPTGTKFVLLHSLPQAGLDDLLKRIYEIYADTVMKNPFHTLEMPINSALFDEKLGVLMGGVNV
ncbi:protein transporter [Cryptococcus neoformans C23]|uniref:Trafficking protein particle complex subunit n=2 Tax=Cryptococcus neoformans TaxID=5207 RepID=A0A854QBW0_CRYNE|nr:protein transporter [Cryptococcus neoformans var. grubii AD2-60a]OWZ43323.1 protein transporter [Cryptococcus neoformans var. grubii AD1-83a]OWZ43868.1 protein transporter [Cryptococcus neoformans var. grubii C23]OWZ78557.1 protein transporter [Cryptococcus neoformans var. grubii Bt85]OXC84601.1 protein transporter [Cryptococcus neoformans var. grubii AD1-7a]OXG17804.1 protein transporter [Cryptococcus neoformans var. grubii Tu401-1]OXG21281.1 protein transporter [Cryptococcus neoformans v